MTEKASVAKALLGSWPQQVSAWGPDAINEYVNELAARGLDADMALDAIRTWPTPEDPHRDFPPSASALARHALRTPDAPTFPELWEALMGSQGVLRTRTAEERSFWGFGERAKADEAAMAERLAGTHPLVQSFVAAMTLQALRSRDLGDPQWAAHRRERLERDWNEFVDRGQQRTAAVLVAGAKRGELRRADPLAAVGERSTEEVAG